MSPILLTLIRRDLLLAARRPVDVLGAWFFFLMVGALFPLAVGPEPTLLRHAAPAIVWIGALLSTLLSMGRLFAADLLDGTLEQIWLSPCPPSVLAIAKVCAHWLVAGLPIVLLTPLICLQFGVPPPALPHITLSVLLGTWTFSLIGAIGAALTLNLRGGSLLMAALVLPLYIPALIFGAAAASAATPTEALPHLQLLAALAATSATLSPWAIAAALTLSLD
jgi:heme exporter protein B